MNISSITMKIEGGGMEVTGKPVGTQVIQITPGKGKFVQEILDGVGGAPTETFDKKKKGEALKFLRNPSLLQDREYSDIKSWQEYFQSLSNDPAFIDLKEYYNLGYINDEDILGVIEKCLTNKSMELNLFIAITETLMPQEAREAQNG